ncbi:MAG: FAD-dependent oxidoreductase [Pseudomonadota bacterium]
MSIKHIAVVGGGIAGLASAIFLGRQGYKVTIYEQADGPRPVGAGFLLQPPGQLVLDKLGVLASVRAQSAAIVID